MSAVNDHRRLVDLTVADAKHILVYATALVLAVALFVYLVSDVAVALLLGAVAGVYLLPVQQWLESRLRTRSESALVTIGLIVVPLASVAGYTWYELSGYSDYVANEQGNIINSISSALARYFPVEREGARYGLVSAFDEAVTRAAAAVQELRKRSALLLASTSLFFFTMFYVLTQRVRIEAYIKLRVPGEYLPLYEKLSENVGGALRGALRAVFFDQLIKASVIFVLNVVFGVPLAIVLAVVTFLIGFFPLLGEWAIYIPVVIYLFVFANSPVSAGIYLAIGLALTASSSLFIRPKLAAAGARHFGFYWMLLALVSGVYTFGIPGIVLGPAILGFIKAVADTLFGDVKFENSLLKEELTTEESGAPTIAELPTEVAEVVEAER